MTKTKITLIAMLIFALAFLPLLHQYIVWGSWFTPEQVLHHETLSIFLGTLSIGILFGCWLVYRRKRVEKT